MTEANRVLLLQPMEFQEQSETGVASSRAPRQLRLLIYRTLRIIPNVLSHRGIFFFSHVSHSKQMRLGSGKLLYRLLCGMALELGPRLETGRMLEYVGETNNIL